MSRACRHRLSVFMAAARIGFRQGSQDILVLFGQGLIFFALMAAYAGIFRNVSYDALPAHGFDAASMIWYMGTVEFVMFCGAYHYKEIQSEIVTEQLYLGLLRPCPLWVVKLGEWSGQYLFRLLALVVPFGLILAVLSGDAAHAGGFLLGAFLAAPLGGLMLLAAHFMIGMSCLWIVQAEPVFWIWQKAMFLFGALIWPLAFYPPLLRSIAWLTPFPALLASSGHWALGSDAAALALGALHQALWLGILLMAVVAANRAVLRRLQRRGG